MRVGAQEMKRLPEQMAMPVLEGKDDKEFQVCISKTHSLPEATESGDEFIRRALHLRSKLLRMVNICTPHSGIRKKAIIL